MTVLPTLKLERWKYSNLPAYVSGEYTETPLSIGYDGDVDLVSQDDTPISLWATETYGDMQLWDDMQDVLSLTVPEGKHVDNPVNLSLVIEGNVKSVGHINIHLHKNASMTIFENIECDGWCNRSMTITLDQGANLTHIRTGAGNGVVTNLTQIKQDTKSKYNAYALNTYGQFMRDQIHAQLIGEEVHCSLSGAKILSDKQHCDTCILIEHMAPNCYSNQNYRNILNDQSRGVFQGKVHVHQIAQQTDGYQLWNSVLLSDKAEMDTKPELEIYADDVKCSHGAVTAQPDAEPLFYLMARGIPRHEAQAILLQAFASESLESFVESEDIYEQLSNAIEQRLNA